MIRPLKVFKFDALGAFVSAVIATYVAFHPELLCMPSDMMVVLSVLAWGICAYGAYILSRDDADWMVHLRRVAMANSIYFALTMVLVLRYWSELTLLGRVYFLVEVLVLLLLIRWENGIWRRGVRG